jgi:hypothetical protein
MLVPVLDDIRLNKQAWVNSGMITKKISMDKCIHWSTHKHILQIKGKAIPVTGRGGPQGSETSKLPHFLDNWLTDGGEVVSLTHRPPFTLQEDSWYLFNSIFIVLHIN